MATLTNNAGTVVFEGTGDGFGEPQFFVALTLQHSAAFANLRGNAPIVPGFAVFGSVTLPPTAFGNNGLVSVAVTNVNAFDVAVEGFLIVQNNDGTIWLEQDTSTPVTIPANSPGTVDFDTSGGGAGVGLSWSAANKQVDIANAGVYSAVVGLFAETF